MYTSGQPAVDFQVSPANRWVKKRWEADHLLALNRARRASLTKRLNTFWAQQPGFDITFGPRLPLVTWSRRGRLFTRRPCWRGRPLTVQPTQLRGLKLQKDCLMQ